MFDNPSNEMLKQHHSSVSLLQRTLDLLSIGLGMLLALLFHNIPLTTDYLLVACLATLLFILFGEMKGLYRSWRTERLMGEFTSILGVWLFAVTCLIFLGFTTKTSSDYSRVFMFMWSFATPIIMMLSRFAYRKFLRAMRSNSKNSRKLAFYGCNNSTHKLAAHISEMAWIGVRVIGVFDDRSLDRIDPRDLSLLGNMQSLVDQTRAGKIDLVYITLPIHAERRITKLVDQLSDTTASVYVVPDFFVFDLFKARWSSIAGMPVVSVFESPFYGIEGWIKRAEDVIFGALILLLILPVMLIIAICIKLTSRGSVLFKQRRYGLNGEIVEVWKFRSMTVCDDGDTVIQAKKNDMRITPLGAFLRRTSLDELPQFINVLQGHMSIVGPRPHAVAHNEQYRRLIHGYMLRHKVKPGITGWAQVNGWRGETDTLDKMQGRIEYDLAYVRNWSLMFDIKIIFMTIYKGFINKNAY